MGVVKRDRPTLAKNHTSISVPVTSSLSSSVELVLPVSSDTVAATTTTS